MDPPPGDSEDSLSIAGWGFSPDPLEASQGTEVEVWAVADALAAGDYKADLQVTSNGGESSIEVVFDAPIEILVAEAAGHPCFQLEWRSRAGDVYVVEMAANLSGTQWTPVSERLGATGAIASWLDCGAGFAGQRFYRVRRIE